MRRFSMLLIVAMLVSGFGCSATQQAQADKGILVAVDAATAAGQSFVDAGRIYQMKCKPVVAQGAEQFCSGFAAFAPKFQAQYPRAVAALKLARAANDVVAAQGATAAVLSLATELTGIVVSATQGVK